MGSTEPIATQWTRLTTPDHHNRSTAAPELRPQLAPGNAGTPNASSGTALAVATVPHIGPMSWASGIMGLTGGRTHGR